MVSDQQCSCQLYKQMKFLPTKYEQIWQGHAEANRHDVILSKEAHIFSSILMIQHRLNRNLPETDII